MPTQNIFDLVDTWALSGGPYTSIKMNATDNDAASASLLMDLQVATASKFSVAKNGTSNFGSSSLGLQANLTDIEFVAKASSVGAMHAGIYGIYMNSTLAISWSSSSTNAKTGVDTYLTRRGAANLRLGAADAASGVQPQTLSVQSITGTNVSAAAYPFTITGAQGTGSAAGGSIVFQVAPAGGDGPSQNALATRLQIIAANAGIEVTNHVYSPSGAALYFASNGYVFGGQLMLNSASKKLQLPSDHMFSWSNDTTSFGTSDVVLNRDDSNKLALRNGTAAQRFNVYNTYTTSTNYEAFKIDWITTANTVLVGTEKGSVGGTARALEFQTDGTTRLAVAATDGSITQTGGGFRINNPLGTQLWFGAESNSLTYVGAISNHSLQLRTNNTERLTLDTTGSVRVVTALTVATLPATPLTGMIARVTDANAPAVGVTVAAGGAAQALCWYNGANWKVIGV